MKTEPVCSAGSALFHCVSCGLYIISKDIILHQTCEAVDESFVVFELAQLILHIS